MWGQTFQSAAAAWQTGMSAPPGATMNTLSRRHFLAGTGAAAGTVLAANAVEAGQRQTTQPAAGQPNPLRYRLGIVTYNIAAAWDVPTILRICRDVGLAAVELRTTHKHGVEPSLSAEQRR